MAYNFGGTYEIQLDAKRRMRVPAKIRSKLGDNYVITVGSDSSLWMLPEETACRLQDKMAEMDTSDPQMRAAKRFVLGSMFYPEEDSQGRFILPKHLANRVNIEKSVVFVGQGNYVEIWSEESYAEYREQHEDDDFSQYLRV